MQLSNEKALRTEQVLWTPCSTSRPVSVSHPYFRWSSQSVCRYIPLPKPSPGILPRETHEDFFFSDMVEQSLFSIRDGAVPHRQLWQAACISKCPGKYFSLLQSKQASLWGWLHLCRGKAGCPANTENLVC